MHKIFFSWQADRSTSACRNIIERALQSAIDRLRTDIDIESAVREDLELDKDTQNIPGTPAIFDTIMEKIATARIFVPDLTFIGKRADGRPTSNPNVLIEYGLALAKPGRARIVTVMNDAYGEPSNTNMPFNLAHTRFPITYTLREDAKEEERNTVRKTLARKLENGLRTIFDSADYLAQTLTMRTHTASDIAALHQGELDYQAELSALHYGDGLARVRGNVENLFRTIERQCLAISNQHEFDLDCGWKFAPSESSGRMCRAGFSTRDRCQVVPAFSALS